MRIPANLVQVVLKVFLLYNTVSSHYVVCLCVNSRLRLMILTALVFPRAAG